MNLNDSPPRRTNKLPLLWYCSNNNALGMVRQWQSLLQRALRPTTLSRKTITFSWRGLRREGMRLQTSRSGAVLDEALATDGPVVVDAHFDRTSGCCR
jgi:thiamine pyrophosphate-dependent acetolactate synthase large subunit-like protein